VDYSSNQALLSLNLILANGHGHFPKGYLQISPEHRVIVTANTWGLGAGADYVGSCKLNAAFRNRFPRKPLWDYDEVLEKELALAYASTETRQRAIENWIQICVAARRAVAALGIKVVVSPRDTIEGANLLGSGDSLDNQVAEILKPGLTEDQWNQVKRHACSNGVSI